MSDMLGLVDIGGGSENERKAARSLVAAYLNASHDGVEYAFSTTQLIAMWDAAVIGGDSAFHELHTLLDGENNRGCDL